MYIVQWGSKLWRNPNVSSQRLMCNRKNSINKDLLVNCWIFYSFFSSCCYWSAFFCRFCCSRRHDFTVWDKLRVLNTLKKRYDVKRKWQYFAVLSIETLCIQRGRESSRYYSFWSHTVHTTKANINIIVDSQQQSVWCSAFFFSMAMCACICVYSLYGVAFC